MSSTIDFFITITCISTHSIISWWCISSIKHTRKHKLSYMNNPYLCVQLFFNIFHLFYVVMSSKRSAPTGRGASSPTDRRLLSDQPQWLWGGWMSFAGFVGGMTNSIFSIHPPKRRWKPRYWHSFESSNELVWACEHPKFWPGSSARVSFAQAKAGPQNGISMAHLHLPQQTQQNFQKKHGEIVRPWWDLNPFHVSKLKFHSYPEMTMVISKKNISVHNPFPLITHRFKVPCRNIFHGIAGFVLPPAVPKWPSADPASSIRRTRPATLGRQTHRRVFEHRPCQIGLEDEFPLMLYHVLSISGSMLIWGRVSIFSVVKERNYWLELPICCGMLHDISWPNSQRTSFRGINLSS